MNVIDMPIAELAPAPYNPRKDLVPGDREYESLKRSIQVFGVVDPVIFNTRTKRVVGGHQRLTVLRDLGHTTAPTVLVELDEVREKALNLALKQDRGRVGHAAPAGESASARAAVSYWRETRGRLRDLFDGAALAGAARDAASLHSPTERCEKRRCCA